MPRVTSRPPSGHSPARARVVWTLLAILVLAIGVFHIASMHVMYDDAFISYRYAANLAHGHGLVYNPGERVEGYSNFLWTLLMAVVVLLGFRPEDVGPPLSAVLAIATLAMVMVFARRRGGFGVLAGLVLAASSIWATWATGGLETSLFTLFVTASALALMTGLSVPGRVAWLNAGAAAAGLACLTRPDGPLVAGLEGLVLVALAWRGRARWSDALRWWAIVALFAVPHEMWRLVYYGHWAPNTYAVKPPGPTRLVFGVRYLVQATRDTGLWLLPLPLVAAALLRRRPRGLGAADAAVLATVVLGFTAYLATTGGDFMPVFRFVAPIVPLASLAFAAALAGLPDQHARPGLRYGAVALAVILVASWLGINAAQSWRQQRTWSEGDLVSVGWARREVDDWLRIGDLLAHTTLPTDTLATTAAGAVPYRSGLYTIDMLGLNAPDLSRFRRLSSNRPGHMILINEQEIADRPPQILLAHPLVHDTPAHLGLSFDMRPEWRARVLAHYELVGLTLVGDPMRYVGCALRRDVADRVLEAGKQVGAP